MNESAPIDNRDTAEERPGGRRNAAVVIGLVGLLVLFGGSLFQNLFNTPETPITPPEESAGGLTGAAENLLSGNQLFSEPDPDPPPPPADPAPSLEDTLADPFFSIDTPIGVTVGQENRNQEVLDALSAPIDGNVSAFPLALESLEPELSPEFPVSDPEIDETSSLFLQSLEDLEALTAGPAQSEAAAAQLPATPEQATPSVYHDPVRTLLPGAVIPVMLASEINSDFNTTWIGRVTHPVFDNSIRNVLIPPGSTVTGRVVPYNGANSIIRDQVALVADTLTRPDGRILTLALPAVDAAGAGGVTGDTDSHFLARSLGTVAFALFSIGPALAVDNGQPQSSRDEATARVVDQTGRTFVPLAQQYASIVPTTIIAPGTRLRLLVDYPLAVEPWSDSLPIVNFGDIR